MSTIFYSFISFNFFTPFALHERPDGQSQHNSAQDDHCEHVERQVYGPLLAQHCQRLGHGLLQAILLHHHLALGRLHHARKLHHHVAVVHECKVQALGQGKQYSPVEEHQHRVGPAAG